MWMIPGVPGFRISHVFPVLHVLIQRWLTRSLAACSVLDPAVYLSSAGTACGCGGCQGREGAVCDWTSYRALLLTPS